MALDAQGLPHAASPYPSVEISVARQRPRHVACSSLTSTSIPGCTRPGTPSSFWKSGMRRLDRLVTALRQLADPARARHLGAGHPVLHDVGRRLLAGGSGSWWSARPGARWGYPALTLSGLVAMLPEVITRLTVDSSASSVAGGLKSWARLWSGNCATAGCRSSVRPQPSR